MNLPRATLVGLLALAALAAASVWLVDDLDGDHPGSRAARGPAWYFDGAQLVAAGDNGQVLYRVSSPRIVQEPESGAAVLHHPVVTWEQGDSPPLRISAASGRVGAEASHLWLGDGVIISDDTSAEALQFATAWLALDTRTQVAHTDAEVVVSSAQGELTGRGLVADMRAGTIRIESAVRGRYVH